jgi:hypothetical protein
MAGTTAAPVVDAAGAPESPYVQPTFNYALRIWWAFFWPLNVAASVTTFVVIAVLYALYGNVMIPAAVVKYSTIAAPFVITYAFAYVAMFYVLGRSFRHFRIGLVAAENYNRPQQVARTVPRVGRVWFAYSWRAIVFGLIAAFVTSFPLGALAGAFERIPFVAPTLRFIFQIGISAAVGLFIFYNNIIDETFGDARVCLLRRDAEAAVPQANAAVGPAVS